MGEVEIISSNFQEFKNIKDFNIKIGEINYIFSISESNTDIKFSITQKEGIILSEYGGNYSLDKLIKINSIFKMFDSIHLVRKSFESLLNAKKYTFEKNEENIIFNIKINFFEEITEVSFILNKRILKKEEIEKIMNRQINEITVLKAEISNLKIKYDREIGQLNKDIKDIRDENYKKINELNKEIKEIKEQNKELINSNQKLSNLLIKKDLYFAFRKGTNYTLTNNGKIAEKTNGGNL